MHTNQGTGAMVALAGLLVLSGCQQLKRPERERVEPPPDPNMANTVVDEGEDPVSARITLLEENERLRELLSDSMSERAALAQDLEGVTTQAGRLEAQVEQLDATIEELTERLREEVRRTDALKVALDSKETERRQIAEMYAAEKHQRLVFEKELLEQEIAARSLSRGKDNP